jgi:GGDEF domain-containing protein
VTAITMALLRLVRAYAQVRALAESSVMARTDELTGLPNRRALHERMTLVLARRPHEAFAVLLTDLDGFKEVNDRLGHAAGDELLRQVAGRLRACMPESGVLARLGGDEFAAMLPVVGQAATVATAMVAAIGCPFRGDPAGPAAPSLVGQCAIRVPAGQVAANPGTVCFDIRSETTGSGHRSKRGAGCDNPQAGSAQFRLQEGGPGLDTAVASS